MSNYFVTIGENGYIESWSVFYQEGVTEVLASEILFGVLDCVKVIKGKAVLDDEKRKALLNSEKELTDLEQLELEVASLKQENKSLVKELTTLNELSDQTDKAVLELTDYVFAGGE